MAMINCPKCSFFQPEDQFCANCGINMQKWTAPKTPLWKMIIGNWMFQLAILFVIIVAVILSDSLSENNEPQNLAEAPRLRRKSITPPEERERLEATEQQENASTFRATQKRALKMDSASEYQPLGTVKAAKALQKEATFEKTISARAYFVPKNNIASILNSSSRLDDNAGSLHRKSFENYRKKKRSWVQLARSTVDFKLNEPAPIFMGARHQESGRNLGFYIQVTVFEINNGQANFEVRVWSELKATEDGSEPLTYEATMKLKHSLVIAQFAPKLSYSEEEVAFIEGVAELRPLNSARFIEDFNDILVVLEIGKIR